MGVDVATEGGARGRRASADGPAVRHVQEDQEAVAIIARRLLWDLELETLHHREAQRYQRRGRRGAPGWRKKAPAMAADVVEPFRKLCLLPGLDHKGEGAREAREVATDGGRLLDLLGEAAEAHDRVEASEAEGGQEARRVCSKEWRGDPMRGGAPVGWQARHALGGGGRYGLNTDREVGAVASVTQIARDRAAVGPRSSTLRASTLLR